MYAMSIDWEQKFFDELKSRLDGIDKKIDDHNQQHEKDLQSVRKEMQANTEISQKTLEQAKHTNGTVTDHESRIKGLEKVFGRKLNFNDPQLLKTARIVFICLAVVVVVVFAGLPGLEYALKLVRGN